MLVCVCWFLNVVIARITSLFLAFAIRVFLFANMQITFLRTDNLRILFNEIRCSLYRDMTLRRAIRHLILSTPLYWRDSRC